MSPYGARCEYMYRARSVATTSTRSRLFAIRHRSKATTGSLGTGRKRLYARFFARSVKNPIPARSLAYSSRSEQCHARLRRQHPRGHIRDERYASMATHGRVPEINPDAPISTLLSTRCGAGDGDNSVRILGRLAASRCDHCARCKRLAVVEALASGARSPSSAPNVERRERSRGKFPRSRSRRFDRDRHPCRGVRARCLHPGKPHPHPPEGDPPGGLFPRCLCMHLRSLQASHTPIASGPATTSTPVSRPCPVARCPALTICAVSRGPKEVVRTRQIRRSEMPVLIGTVPCRRRPRYRTPALVISTSAIGTMRTGVVCSRCCVLASGSCAIGDVGGHWPRCQGGPLLRRIRRVGRPQRRRGS